MKKLELTNALGFDLKKEQLDALSTNGVYTGEMFGEALLNDSRYEDHELLKPYRQGGERSDNPYVNFYWDYYAQGKPCYTEIHFPTLEETIDVGMDIFNRGLCLPSDNKMTPEQQDIIIEIIKGCFK